MNSLTDVLRTKEHLPQYSLPLVLCNLHRARSGLLRPCSSFPPSLTPKQAAKRERARVDQNFFV